MLSPLYQYFFMNALCAADIATGNPDGTETLSAIDLGTFSISNKPTFINVSRILPRNPADCANLDSSVSNNFMVTDELFLKTLPTFET